MDQQTIVSIVTILGAALISGTVSIVGTIIGKRKDKHDAALAEAQAGAVSAGTKVDTDVRISEEALKIIKDLREERAASRQEYLDIKAEVLRLQQENHAQAVREFETSKKIADIGSENVKLRTLVGELQGRLTEQDKTICALTEENKALRAELEQLKGKGKTNG